MFPYPMPEVPGSHYEGRQDQLQTSGKDFRSTSDMKADADTKTHGGNENLSFRGNVHGDGPLYQPGTPGGIFTYQGSPSMCPYPTPPGLRSLVQIVNTPPPPPPPPPPSTWDPTRTPVHGAYRSIDARYTRSPSDHGFVGLSRTLNQRWKSSPGPEQLEKRRVFESALGKRPYYFKGRKNVLSNFFPFNLNIFSRMFCSTEAAYQYCKAVCAECWDVAEELVCSNSGLAAKGIARKVPTTAKWDEMKEHAMKVILEAKMEQCDPFRRFLRDNRFAYLVEDTDNAFWARGSDYKGKNILGHMIMDLREKLVNGDLADHETQKNLKEFMKLIPKWPEDGPSARRQSWSHSNVSSNNSNALTSRFSTPQPIRQPYSFMDSDSEKRRHKDRYEQDGTRKRKHESDNESAVPVKSMKKDRERQFEDSKEAPRENDVACESRTKTGDVEESAISKEKHADTEHAIKRERDSDMEHSSKRVKDCDTEYSVKREYKSDIEHIIKKEEESDIEDLKRRPLEDMQNKIIGQQREPCFKKLKMLRLEWRKEEDEEAEQIVTLQSNTKKVDESKWWPSGLTDGTEVRTIQIKKKGGISSCDTSTDSSDSESYKNLKKKSKLSRSSSKRERRSASDTSLSTFSSRSSRRKSKKKSVKVSRSSSVACSRRSESEKSVASLRDKKTRDRKKKDKSKDSKKKKRPHTESDSSSSHSDKGRLSKKKKKRDVPSPISKREKKAYSSDSDNDRLPKKKKASRDDKDSVAHGVSEKRQIHIEKKILSVNPSSPKTCADNTKVHKKTEMDHFHDTSHDRDRDSGRSRMEDKKRYAHADSSRSPERSRNRERDPDVSENYSHKSHKKKKRESQYHNTAAYERKKKGDEADGVHKNYHSPGHQRDSEDIKSLKRKSKKKDDSPYTSDKNAHSSSETESAKSIRKEIKSKVSAKDERPRPGRNKQRVKSSSDRESANSVTPSNAKSRQKSREETNCCDCYKCKCHCHQTHDDQHQKVHQEKSSA